MRQIEWSDNMVNARPVRLGKTERMSFSHTDEIIEMPNLIEIQKDSYDWFLVEGLKEVFDDVSGISDYSGKRFTAKKTGDTVIELYEFDLNKLNDTAKSVIDSVKNDGTFENAMGETVEDVYLSENGKFLMIYSDKSSDKKSEDHIETKNKVIKAFKEFHAND